MSVTVYSTGPSCQRCKAVKRHLSKKGVPFREVRVDQDEDGREELARIGFKEAPVVRVRTGDKEDTRVGYHPDWLDDIARRAA